LELSYLQQNVLKSLYCYSSHEVSLCGGCIWSLYVYATVMLARYKNLHKTYVKHKVPKHNTTHPPIMTTVIIMTYHIRIT